MLSYLSIALNIVVGLLYTPWIEDQIGQSDFGLYTLANSLITLFLIDFGLSSAVSRYVAYTLRSIAFNIIFYKTLKIDIPLFLRQCYLRMGLPVLLTALAGLGINRLLTDAGWAVLVIKGCAVTVIYLALTALIGLSRQERCDIFGTIKQKLSR